MKTILAAWALLLLATATAMVAPPAAALALVA